MSTINENKELEVLRTMYQRIYSANRSTRKQRDFLEDVYFAIDEARAFYASSGQKSVEHGVQRTVCTACETELSESNVYCPKCGLWNPTNRR